MRYEYLVYNADWLYTNRGDSSSRMTEQFGNDGWELKGVIGDNLIFMRPNQSDLEMAAYVNGKKLEANASVDIELNPAKKRKLKVDNE